MSLSHLYRQSLLRPEWADRSKQIKQRDYYICQKCKMCFLGAAGGGLHVHHKYYVEGRLPWNYPDEALTSLCNSCHLEEHFKQTPLYSEGAIDLVKIEDPALYERERKRSLDSKLKRDKEAVANERLRAEKRENIAASLLALLAMPFVLFGGLLLFLGRLFLLMLGGFLIAWCTYRTLSFMIGWGVPEWLLYLPATVNGICVFRFLNKSVPKTALDEITES